LLTTENYKSDSSDTKYNIRFISSLKDIPSAEWNGLLEDNNPFLSYEFLSALERNDCLGEKYGWYPHHLIVQENGKLIAATPLYIKTNSYGEFVFDWSWASAFEQAGIEYYPKLISSIPYTPATGKRLLLSPKLSPEQSITLAADMIQATLKESENLDMSGAHWLFYDKDEENYFKEQHQMFRLGYQFHWNNQGYSSFEEFLETFVSRKRKKVKQERKYVNAQKIEINRVLGCDLNEKQWQQIHMFYESTFYRKSGIPTLSLEFFKEVGSTMGEQIMLVLSYFDKQLIACAINFSSSHTLYGRFWGCTQAFHSLHFEACYYQGIEYAIENNLKVFEPGAQGEHKISRGFIPTKTWSAHTIHDERFIPAIRDFCKREEHFMQQDFNELMTLSPYKI